VNRHIAMVLPWGYHYDRFNDFDHRAMITNYPLIRGENIEIPQISFDNTPTESQLVEYFLEHVEVFEGILGTLVEPRHSRDSSASPEAGSQLEKLFSAPAEAVRISYMVIYLFNGDEVPTDRQLIAHYNSPGKHALGTAPTAIYWVDYTRAMKIGDNLPTAEV
jgi:hypothetical protein